MDIRDFKVSLFFTKSSRLDRVFVVRPSQTSKQASKTNKQAKKKNTKKINGKRGKVSLTGTGMGWDFGGLFEPHCRVPYSEVGKALKDLGDLDQCIHQFCKVLM